ncbi:MAG: HNH endonuclease [Polaromonas sp.]
MTIKVNIIGSLTKDADGYCFFKYLYKTQYAKQLKEHICIVPDGYDADHAEPQQLQPPPFCSSEIWCYRGHIIEAAFDIESIEEVMLMIKSKVLRHDKSLNKIRREVESLERMTQIDVSRRERISDSVRLFVWQRDAGKCVRCENSEKLEYDHIIPVSKGGSNTERNIQLLCEQCNRSKGAEI